VRGSVNRNDTGRVPPFMNLRLPSSTIALISLTAAVTTGTTVASGATASAGSCPASSSSISAPQQAAIAAAKVAKHPVVLIKDCVFGKPSIAVKKGAKVLVVNEDDVPHTWESTVKAFESGLIQAGKTKTVSIPKNAKTKYTLKCDVHSFMHGSLTVKVS
jgi:plastocyanin